jgi:Polyketide cyclase / dehydrase and lipid transport
MLTTPIRLALRASAGAHASSAAPVSEVWAVLGHPQRWAEFEPFLRSVTPEPAAGGSAGAVEGVDPAELEAAVAAGQHLRAQLRLMSIEVPVSVDHVVDRCSVAVTARLLPGLAEEVEHLVIPSASGGSVVTVRLTLHGPLALPALLPRWLMRTLTVRLLARAAEEGLRDRSGEVQSVA